MYSNLMCVGRNVAIADRSTLLSTYVSAFPQYLC